MARLPPPAPSRACLLGALGALGGLPCSVLVARVCPDTQEGTGNYASPFLPCLCPA